MHEELKFIHIGYHRCGSTTLQTDVFACTRSLSCAKDPHLATNNQKRFNDVNWFNKPPLDHSHPHYFAVSAESLCGVNYSSHQPSKTFSNLPSKIHRNWPNAQILIVFRRQPDLIKSYYSLALRKSQLTISLNEYASSFFPYAYLEYDKLINTYLSLFRSEQVLAIPAEFLFKHQTEAINTLSDHLGVTLDAPNLKRRNAANTKAGLLVLRQCNRALQTLGFNGHHEWLKRYLLRSSVFVRVGGRSELDADVEMSIRHHFRDSNERCSELTGYNLIDDYGY